MTGRIFDIKEFAVHDGPGLVTTVFLKGCPLHCAWCHNPEGQSYEKELMIREKSCHHCGLCFKPCTHPECQPFHRCIHICPDDLIRIAGEDLEAKELAQRIRKNKDILDGVTFSGGEPLFQAEFLLETISYLDGLKIAIETSGYAEPETFQRVIDKTDLVYFDIKLAEETGHIRYTGASNNLILQNLNLLKDSKKPCVIRTPLIPGITDTEKNLREIKRLIEDLPHELLPYNEMAGVKYAMLGRKYPLSL
ncbi:MAG: glycyl-radical enzyme activating protein [Erysipelotrichaceae bacterium]|nr:glycyl-radical enzyme activating protein [Erysipelotrichaceae bacterium]